MSDGTGQDRAAARITDDAEAAARNSPGAGTGQTWVLQPEAAAATGCSISAIRKWRRLGAVASRTVTTAGVERVEVCLEDVTARATRAGLRPSGRADEPLPAAGTAMVAITDLEALFERATAAERRARAAEEDLHDARTELQVMAGRLSELRAQLADARRRPPSVVPESTKEAPVEPIAAVDAPAPSTTAPVPPPPPVPPRRVPVEAPPPPPPPEPAAPLPDELPGLALDLRRLYGVLRRYQLDPASATADGIRAADVAAYDDVLLGACRALMVQAPVPGTRLNAKERMALTQALAEAGLDVRRPGPRRPT